MGSSRLKANRTCRRNLSPVSLCLIIILSLSSLFGAVRATYAAPAPSSTAVKCTPGSLAFSAWAKCTATVTGSSPTGTVTFSQADLNYSSLGTFDSTTCTLSGGSCSVFFDYTASGCIIYCQETDFQITGSYGGDSSNLPSSGSVPKLIFHSCWFAECLYNTYPGEDFKDFICVIGNNPTDTFADCKQVDTDYSSTGFDLSNQGIELPGAGMLSAMAGCVGVSTSITFAIGGPYASGSSPGQVDSAALLATCAVSFPLYMAGAATSALFGGKPVPDSGLAFSLFPLVVAGGYPAWVAMGDLAVYVDLACGFVNYYCYGANLTANIIANPFDIQQKQIPFAPQFLSTWGDHNGFSSIGWSLPSCTDTAFCTKVGSLCGPSGTVAPCINPPVEGTAGEFDTLDIGHPDYTQINTYAPEKCTTGHINSLSIGYDGDADFNINSTAAGALVNPHNEEGGALGAPAGIGAEIPPADRGRTNITPDHLPVSQTLLKLRVGMMVYICGRWVTDTRDLWNELHPVTFLEILPNFTVSASPPDVTVQSGEHAAFTVTVHLYSGPSGPTPIQLSVSGLPFGASGTFSTNPVLLDNPSTMTGTSNLTVLTEPYDLGDYALTISGKDQTGLAVVTTTANLHLYDYNVTLSPPDRTVLRGGSAAYLVTLTLLAGSSTVGIPAETLGATGPPGAALTLGAGSVVPSAGGASTALTVATQGPPSGALGDYAVTVTGTSPGGTVRTGDASVHVYDFQVNATVSPASPAYACTSLPSPCIYVLDTGSNTYQVAVALIPGSSTVGLPAVSLTLTGLPSGATYAFAPDTGTPTFESNLTITTAGSLPGNYTLTITGTDARPEGGSRSSTASLVVLTPQQALQLVIKQVEAYRSAGVISAGQANALITKLQSAINYLNMGNAALACSQLNAFTNIANGYVAQGFLRPAQENLLLGGPLGVYAVMNSIPC